MKVARVIVVALVGLLNARPSWAAETALDLLDAPVAYRAHFYVVSDKEVYNGSVLHVPGRERRDFGTAQGGQALLLQRDEDAAYLLKPSEKWYIGIGLHAAASLAGGIDGLVVHRSKVREETVAGMRCTRYRVKATAVRGGEFDGDAWFRADGIMIKAAGTLVGPDGRRQKVETGLKDVVVGNVSPVQLTLPAGYFGVDLRKVPAQNIQQAVNNIMPMLAGRVSHQ